MIITHKYRIKDATSKKHLLRMSFSVNKVWNYCNEISIFAFNRDKKFLSENDLCYLTSGCSKYLGISSQTIQKICREYIVRKIQFRKIKMAWRSWKRSLGWIPFKKDSVKLSSASVYYFGKVFKFWKSKELLGEIKEGSFGQDCLGRWYVHFHCEVEYIPDPCSGSCVGIDLGLKSQITCSDGNVYERVNITKCYAEDIVKAQRAKKKYRVKKIHAKIGNVRKDWSHKVVTVIVEKYSCIFVGDVSGSKLGKTHLAKSVYDASWFTLRSFFRYKAEKLGRTYIEVKENFSTILCSNCLNKTGPSGIKDLGVREWLCSICFSLHSRDINAAQNILRFGYETLIKGVSVNN